MQCGDLYAGTSEHGICPQLVIGDGIATCKVYDDRPKVCREYPFADIDGGKCFRELKEMKKSTQECRKDCDVAQAWAKLDAENVELVCEIEILEKEMQE
jgi:Fe-S-cluster containining protein